MAGNKKNKRVSAGTKVHVTGGMRPVSVVIRQRPELTEEQSRTMKLIPFVCLTQLEKGSTEEYDWRTVQFRTMVGYLVAKDQFAEDVVEGFNEALAAINAIKKRANYSHDKMMRGTDSEIHRIRIAMEATDEMQDLLNSKSQLKYFQAAQKEIKKIDKQKTK